MAKYREIILKDGRKVFIDNKGNIVESGTFQQPTGENGDTGKQSLASLPVDNNVKPAKIDLLNIDLGDTNKSDGSAVVETPVENAVRRTPATPRRRTASTPVKRAQTSTPAKVVDKRNGSTVTVTAHSKTTPSTSPEVTVESNKATSDSTAVKTKNATPITPAKGYYKGTRYSKNGKYKVYIKSNNSSGWNYIYTDNRHDSVSKDETSSIYVLSEPGSNKYNSKTGERITDNQIALRTQSKQSNKINKLTKKTTNNTRKYPYGILSFLEEKTRPFRNVQKTVSSSNMKSKHNSYNFPSMIESMNTNKIDINKIKQYSKRK